MAPVTLEALNAGSDALFVEVLGDVFEQSPWLVARTAAARPFASRAALVAALVASMRAMDEAEKLALIRAHPDLAGKALAAGRLSQSSSAEQASVGLDRLSADELVVFNQLNADYRARFDMPFIVAVRDHSKASILDAFMSRLDNDREAEIEEALRNIARIVELRILDTVAE